MPERCCLCQCEPKAGQGVFIATLRPSVRASISARHPDLPATALLCRRCSLIEREQILLSRLSEERGELSAIEKDVATRTAAGQLVARQIDEEFDRKATRGNRAADLVASLGGSWAFVLSLITIIGVWMLINARAGSQAFDPFPFILLNLALSCIAALQAPMILMSQNRAGMRDRMKAEQDFLVNLKAEVEVAALHEKVDHLLHVQWEELIEMQKLQIELLRDVQARE